MHRSDLVCLRVGRSLDLRARRFALSAGLRAVVGPEAKAGDFERGAIVAAGPWRDVDLEELREIVAIADEWDQPRSVCILSFASDLDGIEPGAPVDVLARRWLEVIERQCELTDPVVCHGIARTPPGLANATINPATGKHLGLHVDDWDDLPPAQRHQSKNRISINLGPADRHLLFWPRSHSLLHRGSCLDLPYWRLCRMALETCKTVPVVRCCLRPGEAYIAPTETLVHDGSTVGATMESAHITFRSDIAPRAGSLR